MLTTTFASDGPRNCGGAPNFACESAGGRGARGCASLAAGPQMLAACSRVVVVVAVVVVAFSANTATGCSRWLPLSCRRRGSLESFNRSLVPSLLLLSLYLHFASLTGCTLWKAAASLGLLQNGSRLHLLLLSGLARIPLMMVDMVPLDF